MRFTYHTGAKPLAGYTIHRGIHRGGFGEVYFAHSDAGKEVALKLLHHEERDVEIRGVSQCLNLKHPNLVSLFDLKTDSLGDHWIVMEYVSGSSLEDVLVSFPNGLPPDEVRDWLKGLVAGVSHLHDRGIVHRDLKPANVYRENGIVKIGDVGLSKRIDSDRQRLQTQSVGTVYYMAPEVAKGQYGPEVDVYSLGVMLYELITGKLPFQGETTAEILMKHLTAQPDLTPIPKSLRPVLARALEKDPAKRTPTARQLERDFANAGHFVEPTVIPDAAFIPTSKQQNSHDARVNGSSAGSTTRHNTSASPVSQHHNGNRPPSKLHGTFRVVFLLTAAFFLLPILAYEIRSESALQGEPLSWKTVSIAMISLAALGWAFRRRAEPSFPIDSTPRTSPAGFYQRATDNRSTVTPPPLRKNGSTTRVSAINAFDLARYCGSAALTATGVSMAGYVLFDVLKQPIVPSMEHAALFAATTTIATWLLLIYQTAADQWRWKKRARWRARIAAGLLCGTCAFFLDRFLIVDTPQIAFTSKSIISAVGSQPLIVAGTEATWLGYALFFAALFGIRRWSHEMNVHRQRQFGLYPVTCAVILAFLISLVIAFPQWYAMLWAGSISIVAQLATDCRPVEKRFQTGAFR